MAHKLALLGQIALPAIDEFRLDRILAQVVGEEKSQVSGSVLNVKNQFQADLRRELRQSLSREQRIQHKNIEVVKLTNSVWKKTRGRQKRWGRLGAAGAEELNAAVDSHAPLPADVASLCGIAGSILTAVQSLAARLSALDACLGGTGLPDAEKYPMLRQMLVREPRAKHVLEGEGYGIRLETGKSPENGEVSENGKSPENGEVSENGKSLQKGKGSENGKSLQKGKGSENGKSLQKGKGSENGNSLQKGKGSENGKGSGSGRGPKTELHHSNNLKGSAKNEQETVLVTESLSNGPGSTDGHFKESPTLLLPDNHSTSDINSEDSDINAEIFENLINEYSRKTRLKMEKREKQVEKSRPRNPLRLLSACGSISSLDTSYLDRLESKFVPAKSMATVGELPELTLHKKLRINALPLLNERTPSCKCTKIDLDIGGEQGDNSVTTSLSRFLTQYDAQFAEISPTSTSLDMDFDSSGIHSESDSEMRLNTSSDSSGSFSGSVGDTNEYYDSLKRAMRKRSRKRKSTRTKETLPNPKHQPLHRTLQPQQSILKLNRKKQPCEPDCVQDGNKFLDCQFMASPRASFIMEHAAAGEILSLHDDASVQDDGKAIAVSKLKSLLIG